MIKIYSRYLQFKLLLNISIIYITILLVIWLTQSLRFVEFITTKGINIITFVKIVGFLILPMSYMCMPLAVLFGCLITLANFENNNELVILKGAGISGCAFYKSILPSLLLIFCLHLFTSIYLLPKSYQNFRNMHFELREILINAVFEEGVFDTQNNAITLYIDKKIDNHKYKNIFIYDLRNVSKPVTITANFGELIETDEGPNFILQYGTHQIEDKNLKQITLSYFDFYNFLIKLNKTNTIQRSIEANEMYLHQLFNISNKSDSIAKSHIISGMQRIIWPLFNMILPSIVILMIFTIKNYKSLNNYKLLFIAFTGVICVAMSLVLNNLALKKFDFLYLNIIYLLSVSFYIFYKFKKI